ncbi:cytochrome P450 4C1 [Anabrus simplex]|uniref:cytochrome P450 4C1 n=1 Tax=Anabrus simplex TaxID=316456 RepID=UPI0035A2FD31
MSILLLFLLTVCVWCIKFWWSRRRLRELAAQIPGPPTIPLLGNIHYLFEGPEKAFYLIRDLVDRYERKAFRFWMGHSLYICTTNAEDVEQICVKERFLDRDRIIMGALEKFFGKGLLTCEGEYWKHQRKVVAPSFKTYVLESYYSVFNIQACNLVNQLEKFICGDVFDIYEVLSLCTLDMVCESTLGISIKAQEGENKDITHFILNILNIGYKRATRPWLMLDTIFHLTDTGRKHKEVEKILYDLSDSVILNKLRESRKNKESEQNDEKINKRSFLDILINSSESEGANLSNKQLRDEVITILLAGIETTANAMSFTLLLLAYHPQIQEDVYQELKEVFADDWERPVTPEDAKQLQLLDRVFKESLRLFPPVFFTGRTTTKELKLKTCTVPEGAKIFLPLYLVHRDPRFFSDPERFDPDRFLPERSHERHPYSYVPFGAGPRMCIGYKYAEIQMAVTLATVLKKYKFLPAMPYECLQKLEIPVITRPTCGFKIKIVPR